VTWGPILKGMIFYFDYNHDKYKGPLKMNEEPSICLSFDIVASHPDFFEPIPKPAARTVTGPHNAQCGK